MESKSLGKQLFTLGWYVIVNPLILLWLWNILARKYSLPLIDSYLTAMQMIVVCNILFKTKQVSIIKE